MYTKIGTKEVAKNKENFNKELIALANKYGGKNVSLDGLKSAAGYYIEFERLFKMTKYFISTEINAVGKMEDLAKDLQTCYDNGTDGSFKIVATSTPGYMVLFERDAASDGEYIRGQLGADGKSLELVAMQQLADELREGWERSDVVAPVIEALEKGWGNCFDFESGALESITKTEESYS